MEDSLCRNNFTFNSTRGCPEYSDNFYDITAKDVKVLHEQKKITDRIVWSNLFLNEEAKRQKLLQSKLQEPNITIRVRLDNMVILQANFKILEPGK